MKRTLSLALAATLSSAAALSVQPAFAQQQSGEKTIAATLEADGQFTTLLAALKAAGAYELLNSAGGQDVTAFAPTDDAFKALPEGTVDTLLKPENKEKLTNLLKFHGIPGRIDAAKAMKLKQATTMSGETLTLEVKEDKLHVANGVVTKADLECSNGVIHVVDAVLMPGKSSKDRGTETAAGGENGGGKKMSGNTGDGPSSAAAPSPEGGKLEKSPAAGGKAQGLSEPDAPEGLSGGSKAPSGGEPKAGGSGGDAPEED